MAAAPFFNFVLLQISCTFDVMDKSCRIILRPTQAERLEVRVHKAGKAWNGMMAEFRSEEDPADHG